MRGKLKLAVIVFVSAILAAGLVFFVKQKQRRDANAMLKTRPADVLRIFTLRHVFPPELLKEFETETGIKTYLIETSDPSALEHDWSMTNADLATVFSFQMRDFQETMRIEPLKRSAIKNLGQIATDFSGAAENFTRRTSESTGVITSVPLLWGLQGLAFRQQNFKSPPKSWNGVLRGTEQTKAGGRAKSLLRPLHVDFIRWAAIASPDSELSHTQLQERASNLVANAKLTQDFFGQLNLAEVDAVSISRAECAKVCGEEFQFTLPEERGLMWIMTLALTSSSRNKESAHTFVDFMLRPSSAKALAKHTGQASVAQGLEMEKDLLSQQKASDLRTIPLTDYVFFRGQGHSDRAHGHDHEHDHDHSHESSAGQRYGDDSTTQGVHEDVEESTE